MKERLNTIKLVVDIIRVAVDGVIAVGESKRRDREEQTKKQQLAEKDARIKDLEDQLKKAQNGS